MTYFKPKTLCIKNSPKVILDRLETVTKKHLFEWSKLHLFSGQISPNHFKLSPTYMAENFVVIGQLNTLDTNETQLHLKGAFVWKNFIANVLVFAISGFILLFLSYLLLVEHTGYGIISLTVSITLSYILYKQLIGRLNRQYNQCTEAIQKIISQGN